MRTSRFIGAAAGAVALLLVLSLLSFGAGITKPEISRQALKVRQAYLAELGVRENGVNAGKKVEAYLRYAGLGKGNPWCAAFVCWVLGKAGIENPRTGWSPSLFPASRVIWQRGEDLRSGSVGVRQKGPPTAPSGRGIAGNATLTRTPNNSTRSALASTPRTADVFGIYFTDKKRIAHVGFIDSWVEDWVITVEGNTNNSGSREGDGVYRKRRLTQSIYQVARYINHISFTNKQ